MAVRQHAGGLRVQGDLGVLGIRISLNGQSCLHASLCHPVGTVVVALVVLSDGAEEHPAIATAKTINASILSFLRLTAQNVTSASLSDYP